MKLCNRCSYMIKMSRARGNTGLCGYYDARVDADVSSECTHRRGLRYIRPQNTQPAHFLATTGAKPCP